MEKWEIGKNYEGFDVLENFLADMKKYICGKNSVSEEDEWTWSLKLDEQDGLHIDLHVGRWGREVVERINKHKHEYEEDVSGGDKMKVKRWVEYVRENEVRLRFAILADEGCENSIIGEFRERNNPHLSEDTIKSIIYDTLERHGFEDIRIYDKSVEFYRTCLNTKEDIKFFSNAAVKAMKDINDKLSTFDALKDWRWAKAEWNNNIKRWRKIE